MIHSLPFLAFSHHPTEMECEVYSMCTGRLSASDSCDDDNDSCKLSLSILIIICMLFIVNYLCHVKMCFHGPWQRDEEKEGESVTKEQYCNDIVTFIQSLHSRLFVIKCH